MIKPPLANKQQVVVLLTKGEIWSRVSSTREQMCVELIPELHTALSILTGREMAKLLLSNLCPSYCSTSVLLSLSVL